ncbi:MAG: hypothetical protein MUC42_13895, partial [Bryobacter sp.]|nr:hypothetical protein [Bryobacter sp.]
MGVLGRLGAVVLLAGCAAAQESGAGLWRVRERMESSTPERRNLVRVLFYGQSITLQNWWKLTAGALRERFPHADFEFANRAHGGFASPMLRRPMIHDIPTFYPDLVVFHDYGGEPEYEEIIRFIRANTTAEIALQTDHVTWLPSGAGDTPEETKRYQWHEQHNTEWLPALARTLGLELVDVRAGWRKHLAEQNVAPKSLLRDNVHLNAEGDKLIARLVSEALLKKATKPPEGWRDPVTDIPVQWRDGRAVIEFDGNRVEALAARGQRQPWTRARVLIDGKPPSEHQGVYHHTLPTHTAGVDWPWFIQVGRQAALVEEEWRMTLLETDEANKAVRFKVRGSATGDDGEGVSTERFVSKSGRIVIEAGDWHLARAFSLRKV